MCVDVHALKSHVLGVSPWDDGKFWRAALGSTVNVFNTTKQYTLEMVTAVQLVLHAAHYNTKILAVPSRFPLFSTVSIPFTPSAPGRFVFSLVG